MNLKVKYKKLIADTLTPVGIYLKLRDRFANSILLESSDYHGNENSYSFICFKPIAGFKLENEVVSTFLLGRQVAETTLKGTLSETLQQFKDSFICEDAGLSFFSNGLFGYISYNSIRYFEDIELNQKTHDAKSIPDVMYHIYQYVIAINHFNNELYIIETLPEGEEIYSLDYIASLLNNKTFPTYKFSSIGEETSNFTDEEFIEIIKKAKDHCKRGDVFQLVLSREFSQKFKGDEFNVYRALRSVNPSPYLFYFDYGNFKIFGSSPEAQIKIGKQKVTIYPIAGTFKRTGDDAADAVLAEKLKVDPKENAEHVMLVDLARNDLNRNCINVEVVKYREIQYYSHVIHLVSEVNGTYTQKNTFELVGNTFPAGTLSGAPKHMALTLIDKYEKGSRGFYGGCIGFVGFNGDFNHAIMIRSFLSNNNTLIYQAGAGIVSSSDNESELNEVNNKLMALKRAVEMASNI